jgi:hypothetical protein
MTAACKKILFVFIYNLRLPLIIII